MFSSESSFISSSYKYKFCRTDIFGELHDPMAVRFQLWYVHMRQDEVSKYTEGSYLNYIRSFSSNLRPFFENFAKILTT